MLERKIPASTVQDHLQKILSAVKGDAPLTPTEIAAVNAGEDMGLLTIDRLNEDGTPGLIYWIDL